MRILFSGLLAISFSTMLLAQPSSENALPTTSWFTVDDKSLAGAIAVGDPFDGKEGISIAYNCHEGSTTSHWLHVYINNQNEGIIYPDFPFSLAYIKENSNDFTYVDGTELTLTFDDDSHFSVPLDSVNPFEAESVSFHAITMPINENILEKLKTRQFVDIDFSVDDINNDFIDPIGLKNSAEFIKQVKCVTSL